MEIKGTVLSKHIRKKVFDPEHNTFAITNFYDSLQSKDKYTNVNCNGFGRLRKFEKFSLFLKDKTQNTKPLYRGYPKSKSFYSQVFQIAGCNWRCWYCFVDDKILSADKSKVKMLTTDELIELYLNQKNRPNIIDLSGGQPDLVPEWTLSMLKSIEKYGLRNKVYVWIDDNLSVEMKQYLTVKELNYIVNFPKLSKVGSFKGYDECSFVFNTKASMDEYDKQFKVFKSLINHGFDMYAYVSFTAPPESIYNIKQKIKNFIKKLQEVHFNLPLRVIPLKIHPFTAIQDRNFQKYDISKVYEHQYIVYQVWRDELKKQYSLESLEVAYEEINLRI